MSAVLRSLFSREIFLPRGHDYLWTPRLLELEGAAGLAIALGCLVTAASLGRRALARRQPPSRRARVWLAALAGALALTHAFDVWLIWAPYYWLDAVCRCLAAAVAAGAAIASIIDRGDP